MTRSGLAQAFLGLLSIITAIGGLALFLWSAPLDLPLNSVAAATFQPAVEPGSPTPDAALTSPVAPIASEPAAPPADAAAPEPGPQPLERAMTAEARPGDTALKLMLRMGVSPDDAQAATRTMGAVWNLRELRPGQKVTLSVEHGHLQSFRVALGPTREIAAARDDTGGFVAEDQARPSQIVRTSGTGTIISSLSEAALQAGIPAGVLDEMIRAFSYDVDFQREVRVGDTFAVLYDNVHDESGHPTAIGQLIYAEMTLSGKRLRLYRFTPPHGEAGFYNPLGENTRKPLLRTPIDGARITSGFGMRVHPILGYSRMHRGVDFGAPTGTRIYAAGDGKIVRIGQVGGYGNYIEIEHNRQYATAYAHMNGFAAGLREGAHVRQGEVIGYVGMTGMATGPHLHYEVHYNDVQIDPLSVKMPAMTRLSGADLKAFDTVRRTIDQELLVKHPDLVAHAQ